MRTTQPATGGRLTDVVTPGRLFGLTDGIFAISITLRALDVRVPDGLADGVEGFREGRGELYGRFGVFLLAFWIATRFWLSNHAAMAHVHHVDRGYPNFVADLAALGVEVERADVPEPSYDF